MSDALACLWCSRPFRPRESGGRAQRFCRPSCRRAFHAGTRAWALDELAARRVSIGDFKNSLHATRALVPAAFSGSAVQEAPRQLPVPEAPPDEAAALQSDELGALLGDILDTLSTEEIGQLPEPVWALLDFIAGYDAAGHCKRENLNALGHPPATRHNSG
jgi:hypothetical protein